MSKTIAINAGSSSLKWQLYQMPEETVLAAGIVERIGLNDSISTVKYDGKKESEVLDIPNHTVAVKILLEDLLKHNIIAAYDEITGIGETAIFCNFMLCSLLKTVATESAKRNKNR